MTARSNWTSNKPKSLLHPTFQEAKKRRRSCENWIGALRLPVGLCVGFTIHGLHLRLTCADLLSNVDRTNIGNAKIGGLEDDFDLTSTQYSLIVLVFFISYLLCEVSFCEHSISIHALIRHFAGSIEYDSESSQAFYLPPTARCPMGRCCRLHGCGTRLQADDRPEVSSVFSHLGDQNHADQLRTQFSASSRPASLLAARFTFRAGIRSTS